MSEPVMTETSISGENGGKRRARSRKGIEARKHHYHRGFTDQEQSADWNEPGP